MKNNPPICHRHTHSPHSVSSFSFFQQTGWYCETEPLGGLLGSGAAGPSVQSYRVKCSLIKNKKKKKERKGEKKWNEPKVLVISGRKKGKEKRPGGQFPWSGCGMRQRLIKRAGLRRERVTVGLAGGPDGARWKWELSPTAVSSF